MTEHTSIMLYVPRTTALILSAFGLLTMILASIGLYGLVGFTVTQRTHEVGIRLALGAQRRQVIGMVLRQGIRLAGVGIAVGLPVAILAMQPLSRALMNVSPADPITYAAVALLLAVVALVASYVPALHAARMDPMIALRHE